MWPWFDSWPRPYVRRVMHWFSPTTQTGFELCSVFIHVLMWLAVVGALACQQLEHVVVAASFAIELLSCKEGWFNNSLLSYYYCYFISTDAVVSQSSIRELLRNPRATSTAVSTTGLIMDIAGRNPDAEEENDIMRRSMEEDASRVQNGIGNGYSEPAEGLGYGAYPDRPSSRNGDRKQMVTEKLWEASSAPRHSLQSPQPPASTKRVSDKQASRQAASSLSLRSFTNSTDFGASSPEQVTLRSTLRSTVPEASTSKNPRRSMESPELSTTSLRNSSMRFSLEESNSPQPPSSRQTNRSGRSRKAKQQAQSSLDSRITSSIRTDSQASTNTLVSSSDFEYEDDDEVSNQLLTRSIEVKDQRSQEAGFTKASSIQQSVTRGIARFETKEFDKERFSPPLVWH